MIRDEPIRFLLETLASWKTSCFDVALWPGRLPAATVCSQQCKNNQLTFIEPCPKPLLYFKSFPFHSIPMGQVLLLTSILYIGKLRRLEAKKPVQREKTDPRVQTL